MFHVCLCFTVLSVPYCWGRDDVLVLLFLMFSCVLSFQIWCAGPFRVFDLSIPDICFLFYFDCVPVVIHCISYFIFY